MRLLLFFDLPVVTKKNRKDYRIFVRKLKKMGFYMIQESVYAKMTIDSQNADSTIMRVRLILPPVGSVCVLNVTEKQFAGMDVLLGSNKTDVVNNTDRVVII